MTTLGDAIPSAWAPRRPSSPVLRGSLRPDTTRGHDIALRRGPAGFVSHRTDIDRYISVPAPARRPRPRRQGAGSVSRTAEKRRRYLTNRPPLHVACGAAADSGDNQAHIGVHWYLLSAASCPYAETPELWSTETHTEPRGIGWGQKSGRDLPPRQARPRQRLPAARSLGPFCDLIGAPGWPSCARRAKNRGRRIGAVSEAPRAI
eukprot:scaffold1410_cov386-Prasinococcus_capsulatus_cf.AAC.20